jgi:hypothetical protein
MVPTPGRGYWVSKAAGKKTLMTPLPERPPAMDDVVQVGGRPSFYSETEEELLGPLPPAPQFDVTLDVMREHIVETIGKVTVPCEVRDWYPAIERLLKADQVRREKLRASQWSWNKPLFDEPDARRRIRILNALFFAIGKCHGKSNPDKDAVRTCICFFDQFVYIKLAASRKKTGAGGTAERLTLSITDGYESDREIQHWSDADGKGIERQLTRAAVEIVYLAEVKYRESTERQYQWRIKRKAELEDRETGTRVAHL